MRSQVVSVGVTARLIGRESDRELRAVLERHRTLNLNIIRLFLRATKSLRLQEGYRLRRHRVLPISSKHWLLPGHVVDGLTIVVRRRQVLLMNGQGIQILLLLEDWLLGDRSHLLN